VGQNVIPLKVTGKKGKTDVILMFCKGKQFNLLIDQLVTPTTNKLSLLQ